MKLADLIGKKISVELEKIQASRELQRKSGNDCIRICSNDGINFDKQIICPIVNNGDVFGAVVLYTNDKNSNFSDIDIKLCVLACNVIAKYFD